MIPSQQEQLLSVIQRAMAIASHIAQHLPEAESYECCLEIPTENGREVWQCNLTRQRQLEQQP